MKRRQVLATVTPAVVAAGGGYLASALTDESGTDDSEVSSGNTFERTATIADATDLPESSPVRVDTAMTRKRITADQSAILTLTATNESDDAVHLRPPLYRNANENREQKTLYLYSVIASQQFDREYSPNCPDEPNGARTAMPSYEGWPTSMLDPGESTDMEFVLIDDITTEGCLVPGTYRYENEVRLADPGSVFDWKERFGWGMTIKISELP